MTLNGSYHYDGNQTLTMQYFVAPLSYISREKMDQLQEFDWDNFTHLKQSK